ncbi:sodium-translocating pyrophosphatase [Patescibacteria group bacterium]|nr:sodium-translocating pyrophosphatase [Patescibacteria group bacterium]
MLYFSIVISMLGLLIAFYLANKIKRINTNSHSAEQIAELIKNGAMSFLKEEYRVLKISVIIVFFLLFIFLSIKIAITFIFGAILAALSGNIGMRIATIANIRTAEAVQSKIIPGLKIAFNSGTVMGLTTACFGLTGISIFYIIFQDIQIIYGFGLGASLVALFARVGGGIYTKAADVGADLAGKIEASIPEDDPRNPAIIADNVGDNVGDVAGMGADLFESYVNSLIASMALGMIGIQLIGKNIIFIPLTIAAIGIISSLIGYLTVYFSKSSKPAKILDKTIWASSVSTIIGSLIFLKIFSFDIKILGAIIAGLVCGVIIGATTQYFTSNKYSPTKNLAKASITGAGTNIISGISLGMKSTLIPMLAISATILISHKIAGVYGVSLAAIGMLSILTTIIAIDAYGSISDNAAGIAEMAKMGKSTRKNAERLDSIGNTTAAIGKGFAIGSAALTAIVLLTSYLQSIQVKIIDLNRPEIIVGLFIGGLMPFLFSSITMQAVSKTAEKIVQEVRRQFKEIKGLIQGETKPDYQKCITISTNAALGKMVLPSIITIIAPILIGIVLGKQALGGFLVGAILVGFLLAVMMANSGGAWDNAKKYIEQGNLGGKGSDAHKSSIIGDTVGDPFKDTAGPSLNILIKLMSIVSLIIAPLL